MDVSIIVPCYNAIGKIERCLESLKAIEYPHHLFEVIFVDDCSTDDTYQLLWQEVQLKKNWRLHRLEKNSGSPSKPRNEGISKAAGEFVFFLDCDDEIFPDTIRSFVTYARLHGSDIVRGYLVADDGKNKTEMNRLIGFDQLKSSAEKTSLIVQKQSTTPPGLIKRELLQNNRIHWPESIRMGEDSIFLFSILTVSKSIGYIEHPTYVYHKEQTQNASSTQTYGKRELLNHLEVWQTSHELLSKIGLDYYQLRLQVGLQTAIQSMIKYNKFDIDENSFLRLSAFVNQNWGVIERFNYIERIKQILDVVRKAKFTDFQEAIKQRLVVAGYDLKFIEGIIPHLKNYYQVRIDEWQGHDKHDEKMSQECIRWADVVFCEWMLGNAVWYSRHIGKAQKLVIRMHRFELTTGFYKRIDFHKVDAIIAVSVYFLEKLLEYTGLPRGKARLLPNYLDADAYQQGQGRHRLFNLAMIGIVPSRKGYKKALMALAQLVKIDKRYRLYIYGKMPEDFPWIKRDAAEWAYYQDCEQFISDHHLEEYIHIKGWANVQTELVDIGFVLSTSDTEEIFESFHIAPADGFAAGAQGVLLDWNGVEYIYPSKYIVNGVDGLVDRITAFQSEDQYKEFNQEGVELISGRYSIHAFMFNFKQILKG